MSNACLFRILPTALVGVATLLAQETGGVTRLTLTEAVHLAIAQNRDLKIARLRVAETQQKKAVARANYFPELKNESSFHHTTALENIEIPRGALGVIPGVAAVPYQDVRISQGGSTVVTSSTTLAQPLTQLIRIRQANRIAASALASSKDDVKKTENAVAVRVHEIYYGILVAGLQKRAADQQTVYAEIHLRESEDEIRNGSALKISAIDGRAGLLQSEQARLSAELQLSDLTTELNDLLGLPLDTKLELSPVQPAMLEDHPREDYVRLAWADNPEILAATESIGQAEAGVAVAKSAYIPDITAVARQYYQNGVPFLLHNFGTFGVTLSYDVFDFGKRRAEVREQDAKLAQAQENLARLKEAVNVQVERTYNKVERTKHMLQVASEVVKLREEGERLAQNQMDQGVVMVSARRQASADSYKAQADMLQAQLAYLLAGAELDEVAGRTPGL